MTAQEINEHVVARVKPILDELGYEGFVLIGYVTNADGQVMRSLVIDGKNNPMVQDALTPMIAAASAWAGPRRQ